MKHAVLALGPSLVALLTVAASMPGVYTAGAEVDMGEVLYNGVSLPAKWPPCIEELTREPMRIPYLERPPAVIPIDVGRQLFVDDFLIEETTLERTFHAAEYYHDNPVLTADQPWEQEDGPTAMVFSDGVFYDPQDGLFKMWYMGGYCAATCYATSKDGINWEKPLLDVKPGTNIVQPGDRDSATVWLDLREPNLKRRYKLFRTHSDNGWGVSVYFSADGIHWGEPVVRSGPCGDRTTVFYNPFRNVWVYSLRTSAPGMGRSRRYWENADVIAGARWEKDEAPLWIGADRLDKPRRDLGTTPQLYNLDAVAYESLMLGLFTIWRGQPEDRAKPNEVCLGFSRDGFHWDRPSHAAFIPVSEHQGDWNWGNVQSAGGGCLVVGDKLYFYVSGRAGVPGSRTSGVCSTGLATLRRDGFASMNARDWDGTLTTRPVRFRGKYLFVNVHAPDGELRVEVLDEHGETVRGFGRRNCLPVTADSTLQRIRWRRQKDLSRLAGEPVRFRFHVTNGRLYSFWVSPDESGASHGYVAAGGPGFAGIADAVGAAALAKAEG